MPNLLLIAALSYLLGSIPFGYLLIRFFRGQDVRLSGSGNIGATNVSRTSLALGIFTLVLDALKGTTAVALSYLVAEHMAAGPPALEQLALGALFAILGHMFPVWLKFRGGKGVATGLGAFLLIAPKAILIAVCIFVAVVVISRYVSLGSMVAVAAFPFMASLLGQFYISAMALALVSVASLLILLKHRKNVQRLWLGAENRLGTKHA